MADYNSSLPIRTENAGDAIVKIADATVPSQQLAVESDGSINVNASFAPGSETIITDGTDTLEINSDGSLNITDNGASLTVDAVNLDIRDLSASQDNIAISDGTEIVAVNASNELQVRDDDANAALSTIAADTTSLDSKFVDGNDIGDVTINNSAGASAVNIQDGGNSITVDGTVSVSSVSGTVDVSGSTVTIQEPLSIDDNGSSITVDAVDLDIRDLSASTDSVSAHLRDASGVAFSNSNPLPVSLEESSGVEVSNYQTSSSVAKDASVNHDYTVTAATTLLMSSAHISGSGKLKAQLLVNGAVKYVAFNSTANPNIDIPLYKVLKAAATQVVRITITNLDSQAQDLYSTLLGVEV